MGKLLLAAAAIALTGSAQAQTQCQMIGGQMTCSNGLTGRSMGGSNYYSDGTITTNRGGTTTFSSPNPYLDGLQMRRDGNTTTFSNGTQCRTYDSRTFCN
jgi:hypothetical protein